MAQNNEAQKNGIAIGRRKSATARVRLIAGTGQIKINKILGLEYFHNSSESLESCRLPLHVFGLADTYDIEVQTHGGGLEGQLKAIRLGIARVLAHFDNSKRPKLKSLGLLQRDSRIKERKKYGLKKARKASQYSKR
uniref:Ribosomal protein S9 n=1 Tax=Eustigmatophyceae sp. Chic 10/23 P-6w TaxID=1446905 RepID=A0A451FM94_9STRA|nr:ribosomal protein S9 [Eustigmatophyceae sp. Chic 10/23 P-6w]QAA11516.1 ribosomal protein S9 [Eustigmatophyceae sp. Chic 10/23 P-6w]